MASEMELDTLSSVQIPSNHTSYKVIRRKRASMLEIKLNSVLEAIVEHELIKKGGRDKEALHFHLDIRLHQNEDTRSCGLHMLYHVRPGYSYVDVFSGETDSPFGKIDEVKEWKHLASHDSCWRDIKCFSAIYFRMAEEINEVRVRRNLRRVAPKDMYQHNNFAMFGELYRWVPIQISREDPNNSYCKSVTILK